MAGMKVSELEGVALDRWVAKAVGHAVDADGDLLDVRLSGGAPTPFHPSTDWQDGGPIIERERITLQHYPGLQNPWLAYVDTEWSRGSDEVPCNWKSEGEGETPLIAAMRSYVALKFGEEVPDEEGVRG